MHARLLPEWSPCEFVLLAWPNEQSDWGKTFKSIEQCYFNIASALSKKTKLVILISSSQSELSWRENAVSSGVLVEHCHIISSIPYNDTWVRDYAPLSKNNGLLNFVFNAWGGKYEHELDNAVASTLADELGHDLEEVALVVEGGGLEINDRADLLLNANCVVDENRNRGLDQADIESLLKDKLGANTVSWLHNIQLSGDDTDGHIDTIARFIDDTTIVYAGPNAAHPDNKILKNLEEQLRSLADKKGWELIALPTPLYRSAIDKRLLPATYANFLHIEDTIFVPNYGISDDLVANQIFCHLVEGQFTIVPVRCEALLEQNGSLHCATMQFASQALDSSRNKIEAR